MKYQGLLDLAKKIKNKKIIFHELYFRTPKMEMGSIFWDGGSIIELINNVTTN